MKQTFRSILEYVGTLDSTRTAHYLGLQENDERWWIPNNEDAWNEQVHVASATSLARILRGDVLCIPRNQFFDSPGWLILASYLTRMRVPTFSIRLDKNLNPNPENFIREITEYILRNPKFALSGWPGLSLEQRNTMADNIEMTGNFKFSTIFRQVTIDSSTKEYFEAQCYALQSVWEYITKKRLEDPGFDIISRSTGYRVSPWDRLKRDFRSRRFKNDLDGTLGELGARKYLEALGDLMREMPKKARADVLKELGNSLNTSKLNENVNRWLGQRTNLYRAISDYSEATRQLLREHINFVYHDALAESVTDTGRLLLADHANKGVPYKTRQKHLDTIDRKFQSEKLVAIPSKSSIDTDTIADIVMELNDEKIQESLKNYRNFRESKGTSAREIDEREDLYLEVLTNRIPSLIVDRSTKSKIIDFSFNKGSTAIKIIGWTGITAIETILGSYLASNNQFRELIMLLAGTETGKVVISNIVDETGAKLKSAKNGLKAWLNNKESKIIAGRVREWLKSAWEDNKEG